ncbi:MAG: glycosyltransferase, partial [Saprospiraceae bacterium]|nr:glycosyltransferase [Saprospiraceae bacterium]
MLIDILIPTYNRAKDLIKNLKLLYAQLQEDELFDNYQLIISDNCSPDNTEQEVAKFMVENPKFNIQYYRNSENIGLEPNAVEVMTKSSSKFIIFLGDDDYLATGYLKYCIDKIQENPNLGCILPGALGITETGESNPRPADFDEDFVPAGFDAVFKYSHFGHQLSGVLCKNDNLLKSYLKNKEYRNPYLFLYFSALSLYRYDGIYAPKYKTRITLFNAKDWGYNAVGLLDEVYKCYYPFIQDLGEEQVTKLLLRFTVMHSYRLAFAKRKMQELKHQNIEFLHGDILNLNSLNKKFNII